MTRGLHFQRAKPFRGALLPAMALALIAGGVRAQDVSPGSVGDYQLPAGPSRPASPAQGPIDEQVPVVRPTRAAPPEPDATPDASASPSAQSVPTAAPDPRRARTPAIAPRLRNPALPAPGAAGPVTATAPAGEPSAPPLQAATEASLPNPAEAAPAVAPSHPALPLWPIALVVAALLLGGAFWLMRRTAAAAAPDTAEDCAPAAAPLPAMPTPPPTAVPVPPGSGPLVTLDLEAHHLSRSLVFVTLAYRLTVANAGTGPLGPLRIAGDLASAHASQSRSTQLSPAAAELEQRHAIARLEPGEAVALSGEMRLPVAAILPIRQGAAHLFVPLARFMIFGPDGLAATRVFVVGQPGEQPGSALRPFRIDAMPGVFRELGQREIAAPA